MLGLLGLLGFLESLQLFGLLGLLRLLTDAKHDGDGAVPRVGRGKVPLKGARIMAAATVAIVL
jgi:hypothetical protein